MSRPVRWLLGLFALMSLTLLVPIACRRVEPYDPRGGESGPVSYGSSLTAKPNAPTHFKAAVLNRRATSFITTWTAPSDAYGNAVAGYVPMWARGCPNCTVTNADGGIVDNGSCVVDGGGVDGGAGCPCVGYPGCKPGSMSFDQAIDAGVAICRGNWTRVPVKPGQQETWSTNEGSVCPPDGGSGLVQ